MGKIRNIKPLVGTAIASALVTGLGVVVLMAAPVITKNFTLTSGVTSSALNLIGTGVSYHKFKWYVGSPAYSSCSLQLETSFTNGSTWQTFGSPWDCISNGESDMIATLPSHVRFVVTYVGGSGPLVVNYAGYIDLASVTTFDTVNDVPFTFKESGTAFLYIDDTSVYPAVNESINVGTPGNVFFSGYFKDLYFNNSLSNQARNPILLDNAVDVTISSGFGTSPSIVGRAYAFKVTVGSGGDTSGVVNFNSTFPSSPVCIANNNTTTNVVRCAASTTQVTLTGTFAASDVLSVVVLGL